MWAQVIVIGSGNALIGLQDAWAILSSGGTALDAIEAATRVVEDNEDDHSVGYGGYPNLVGEVELDAALMDGANRRVGAVGSLKGFRHPITVARAVMEQLPHTFLVGDGAARFATELGLTPENLLTEFAERAWREGLEGRLPNENYREPLSRLTALAADPTKTFGTVNVLAKDANGHIAAAVSTSGWAWKYPGRIGDSPVVGAGLYADDRYGAVGCTGMGELSMRAGLARDVIARLAHGAEPERAGREAIEDMSGLALDFPKSAIMQMVVLSHLGEPAGFSTRQGDSFAVMSEQYNEPQLLPCRHVEWPGVDVV